MFYLLLSILFSTLLVVIFKLFDKYKIQTFQAIVFNYITAAALGFSLTDLAISVNELTHRYWFPNAVLIGILFISLFYVIAITAQQISVSVASIANKMSVVIPVSAAFYLYSDTPEWTKITGIILALIGVVLASIKKEEKHFSLRTYFWPILLFIGSGFLDTFMKYTQHYYLTDADTIYFIPVLFSIAAFTGIIILFWQLALKPSKFEWKCFPAGVVLGACNYASIFFLLKSLQIPNMESSVLFSLNNVGIVIASAFISHFVFKNTLSKKNWFGVALSAIAIILIMMNI
jgi:drug/metabolite transporter (DMT)-like permease